MIFPEQNWTQSRPQEQGIDEEKLNLAIENLRQDVGEDGMGELFIVRHGHVIWQGDNVDKIHGVWSATKSFVSTALGLLIDDGKTTLDTPAAQFVPELSNHYPAVTLRHFATMTSGYRAVGDEPLGGYAHGPSSTPFEPDVTPLFTPPGSRFAYWDSAMNQFAHVLTRIAGEPLQEFIQRRIADPIGLASARWNWGEVGQADGLKVNGGAGNLRKHIEISARDLARFGLLYLNRGRWDGKQLVSEERVEQATSTQVPATLPLGHEAFDGRGVYGFNWWTNGLNAWSERKWPGAPEGTFAAAGFNNNKCLVVPEWNLVIVRLGLDGNVGDEVWSRFFEETADSLAA